MKLSFSKLRLSFQGKVLIPVILLLVLVPALTVGLIQGSSMKQLQREARQKLNTADAVFKKFLATRASYLISHYKQTANEPRFRAAAQLADARTMRAQLNDLLDELGEHAELMLFVSPEGDLLADARKGSNLPVEEVYEASLEGILSALQGQPESHVVSVGKSVLNIVSVPVTKDFELLGALVVGVQVGDSVVQELTSLSLGEVAIFKGDRIVASSLPRGDYEPKLLRMVGGKVGGRQPTVHEMVVGATHYMVFVGEFPGATQRGMGYVLLSSYEQELQEMNATQNWLWALSVFGAFLSTGVVWVAIGRIMKPLHELRNTAEAVGQGDFSQRVTVRTSDEVGQLAQAFNQMTKNLQGSHAELRKTLQTLKNTQAQLIQSEKLSAVGEFVAGIAHELNNPLTSVIGFGELLRQTNLDNKQGNFVNCIVKSSERCHKIVQGLLSFARQAPPERKPLKLNEAVGSVLELMTYEMRTSNISVETQVPDNLPYVMGDPHQLQQVFLNILNNSRQALEERGLNGRITISLEGTETHVRLTFSDNGPGIPPDNLAKIFDPFFTTKPVGKGTGLGLSLCYGIIKEHGGAIRAENGIRGGAIFTIELPICPKADLPVESDAEDGSCGTNGQGKKALVIDDEVWILDLIRQILQRDGFEVETVSDGKSALDRVARDRYELLVCDWKMPGISGPQLYEQLSALSPEAASRLIFMTGDVVSDTFQTFLKKHAKNCLSKPFSVSEFRHTISHFLGAQAN